MIPARLAADQGRTVFAVPGRIDQSTSAGCHRLIRDGAVLLTGVDDILSELSYLKGFRKTPPPAKTEEARQKTPTNLTEEEQLILGCLEGGILTQDAISERSGLASPTLAAGLMMLELKRLVSKRLDGSYEGVVA